MFCSKSYQYRSLFDSLVPIWMAPLEQQGSKEKGMTNHDMGVHIQKEESCMVR